MPTCENCGAHVTKRYVRVLEPGESEDATACPFCDDLIRAGSTVREARATRRQRGSDTA